MIYIDPASLFTATKSPHLSQRVARWLTLFRRVQLRGELKPGKQNALADALSRRPDYELSNLTTITSPITELIRSAYAKDEQCVALLRTLKTAKSGFNCRLVCVQGFIDFLSIMT